jgi:cobalt/nickel transport system permease protein
MVKFPLLVVPAYGHLLGGVLAAVIAGPWAGCLAIALVLFLQMTLFADGGWFSYGANVLNMGVVGAIGGYAVFAMIRRWIAGPRGIVIGAVVASWSSVVAASALFCVEFALSQPAGSFDLPKIVALMTSFHSLVGVGEALITGGIVSFVVAQRPDLIVPARPSSEPLVSGAVPGVARFVTTGIIAALVVAAFLAPFATEGADGLEAVAERAEFADLEHPPRVLLLDDYVIPIPGFDLTHGFWQKASVSLAGIFGTSAVLGLAWMFGRALRPQPVAAEVQNGG